jgi:hypothetical protein
MAKRILRELARIVGTNMALKLMPCTWLNPCATSYALKYLTPSFSVYLMANTYLAVTILASSGFCTSWNVPFIIN